MMYSYLVIWERERDWLTCCPTYAFIGWFLYAPWLQKEPAPLSRWDDALTNWATRPGLKFIYFKDSIYWIALCCCWKNRDTTNRAFGSPLKRNLTKTNWIYFLRFYLYTFRANGKERGRETSMCERNRWAASQAAIPRHVPWPAVEPATLWFVGWCSIHWATPAKATLDIVIQYIHPQASLIWCTLCFTHDGKNELWSALLSGSLWTALPHRCFIWLAQH